MIKTTIRTVAAASVLALLTGCGGSGDANGGKEAGAPAGKPAWNAADACTLLDKGAVGAALQQDVAAFLTWTAEPKLDKRKQTGWPVLGFLLFATVLAYLAKQQVWAGKKGKKAA